VPFQAAAYAAAVNGGLPDQLLHVMSPIRWAKLVVCCVCLVIAAILLALGKAIWQHTPADLIALRGALKAKVGIAPEVNVRISSWRKHCAAVQS